MKLVDSIAPFIDIIIQIVFDIKYFMMVFIMAMVSLALSFFLLAQNQLDYDLKKEITDIKDAAFTSPAIKRAEWEKKIPYSTFGSSLWYMW